MSLVINYIEIENFKSYYGKNILGPFHQSFNAVIGPNGSGKSNVIDSLLFVFGFRAQKIRTKKISVLIHNSDQHPNVSSCSVTIFFRKIKETSPNTYEIVPNSDFTVKRTAYKDNSSDYHIDDRKVQYKEVAALLRECGVDLDHNRFLILQGEVESISLLKPKAANEHEEGLLEYLEDIIGTIRYKPMLEEVAVEIDKTNEIRTEKANRVQNLQKDKNSLEGPKNEAINYLKKENELIENKNFYYQLKMNEISKSIEESKESCETTKKDLDELNEKLTQFSKENEESSIELNGKKKDYEKKQRHADKLKKKLEDLEKEDVESKQGIKHAKEQVKKLTKNIETESEKLENLNEIPERNEKKIEELKEILTDLQTKVEPANKILQSKMDQVNLETKAIQEKKNSFQAELAKLQSIANEAKSKMDLAQSQLDVYLNGQNYEQNKLDETREKLNDLVKLAGKREKELKEINENLPRVERDFSKANKELEEVNVKEKRLNESLNKNRQRFVEAQSSVTSSRNKNKVISFLSQLKKDGKLNGFYGRLGDLGAIDDKYDVAISTACGSLDCIVVDTIDTAQKCVEYLKNNSIGSATFIALDKQDRWLEHLNRKINTPENVSRLVDLIKVNDKKFLTAFYYSLRNTLVADDLEQATRIAYGQNQRYRVVTLKGEIIEVSGTMSGGGQPMKGRMGTRIAIEEFSSESIKNMQETIKQDEMELREIVNRKYDLDPMVYELKTKMEEYQENKTKFSTELEFTHEQIKELKKFEAVCLKKVKEMTPDEAKQSELETMLGKYREEYNKADGNAAKLRDENEKLHQKIVEISKNILEGPKSELEKLEKEINDTNSQITNLTVEIKTSKRQLITSEKKLNSLKEELEQNEKNLAKFEKRLETLDQDVAELKEQYEQIKEECDQLSKEISEMSKTIKQLDTKRQKLETEKIDLNHSYEKLLADLQHHEREFKHYEHSLLSLKLHVIDDLENIGGSNETDDSAMSSQNMLKKYDQDDMMGVNIEAVKRDIHKLEEHLKSLTPNLTAIQNYRDLQSKFMERVNELEQITQQRDELCTKFEELRKKRLDEFMGGFTQIRLKLKEIYRTVTLEGDAELELVDSLDPFTEGIVLSVRPPKKSWKNVSNLSGGEKTLSSLSLVFALHEFRATPIYVMDEIDAALDFKNVSIIAHYIKERTKNAQFIIISLRNNMFELCDRLFGIYKVRNCTSATYISPELIEFDEKKKQGNKNKQQQQQQQQQNANTQPSITTSSAAETVSSNLNTSLNTSVNNNTVSCN